MRATDPPTATVFWVFGKIGWEETAETPHDEESIELLFDIFVMILTLFEGFVVGGVMTSVAEKTIVCFESTWRINDWENQID
jgi:hypothetical protein